MKAQAALIQYVDEKAQDKEPTCASNLLFEIEGLQEKASHSVSSIASCSSKDENDEVMLDKPVLSSPEETAHSLSMKSIGSDDEFMIPAPSIQNLVYSERRSQSTSELEYNLGENCEAEINGKLPDGAPVQHSHERKGSASSIPVDIVQPSSRGERVKQLSHLPSIGRRNGVIPQMTNCKPSEMTPKGSKPTAVNADDSDEKSKGAVVQQKGRFKVTSENALPPLVIQKSHSMQTNVLQRDYILNLMRQVNTGDTSANRIADGAGTPTPISSNTTEKSMLELAHEREKELLQEITDLQWRLVCAQEEIQRIKTRKS